MQNYTIKENFIASDTQQVFILNNPFVDDTVNVYVNKALQSSGEQGDYITLGSNGKIIFKRPLKSGDIVSVITNQEVTNIKIMSYGKRDTSNALYQKYSSETKLKPNNTYKVYISIDDKPIEWSFSSQLSPYFTTIRKIQEDIGEFIVGFTDRYIASMIHRNSCEIVERINEASENTDKASSLNENASNTAITDSEGLYSNSWRVVNNWVRFKTEIDLIYARYLGISYRYGDETKTVGDITIQKGTKLPYIDNLLERLKKGLDDAEEAIFGSKNFVYSFQKGSTKYDYETIARSVNWES